MFELPKISVITASLNQGKFIEETILSVLCQDYPNIEYLIIDGGSKDCTLDVIKKYQNHIDYWVSEPDKGQSDAINKGLERVTGEIVTWINSDDQYFSKNIFKKVSNLFLNNSNFNVCYGDNVYIDEYSSILYMRKSLPFFSKSLLNIWNYVHQPTVFLRKDVVDQFSLNLDLHYIMDYEYWLRIAQQYKFKYLNALISASRWHDECKTMGNADNFFLELKKVHSEMGKKFRCKFISYKYIFKFFYNIQRIYSLPFIWRLNCKDRLSNIRVNCWMNLIKRQIFGLRLGRYLSKNRYLNL